MTHAVLIETVGWIGAVLILAAYGLLTAGKLGAESAAYQAMNVVGAVGIGTISAWRGVWPSVILNIVWAGIGLVALSRLALRRRPATAE